MLTPVVMIIVYAKSEKNRI